MMSDGVRHDTGGQEPRAGPVLRVCFSVAAITDRRSCCTRAILAPDVSGTCLSRCVARLSDATGVTRPSSPDSGGHPATWAGMGYGCRPMAHTCTNSVSNP